ncbi:hypothetical protein HCH_03479 [Hahella chejuensis KCTC 2396]|uniref:Uncharacterized protein n=1 Tax=Hahella chejuensis (strain KCTC 2396) TaxID=349521 RepID=Q2SGJ9_HAHCH|nr:hypothetical protein HCH_03479 [Hahella chejuensis KCTC 2396]
MSELINEKKKFDETWEKEALKANRTIWLNSRQ